MNNKKFTQIDRIFYGEGASKRNWYEVYHKYGYYWAKFELTSGPKYAKTPKQCIKWILESHFKKRF